jgi:hypothetical protein
MAEWEDIEVIWFYLRKPETNLPGSVYLGEPLIGAPILHDLLVTPRIWLTGRHPDVEGWANQILASRADVHWVVGMNEGFWVGNALRRLAPEIPLHVSIQDDQEQGMFGRMRRYWWMARMVRRPVRQLLRGADGVDVTSDGMRDYYRKTVGIEPIVAHPFVARLPSVSSPAQDSRAITIGHIGSLYDGAPFLKFLEAAKRWSRMQRRQLHVALIGLSRPLLKRIKAYDENITVIDHPNLLEAEAVQHLAKCNFVYAMYPFERNAKVFRTTSLPTKLSTYVQSQRPIFAHTPEPSTLASFINETGLGVLATEMDVHTLQARIGQIMRLNIEPGYYEAVRERLYGAWNTERMHACLTKRQ